MAAKKSKRCKRHAWKLIRFIDNPLANPHYCRLEYQCEACKKIDRRDATPEQIAEEAKRLTCSCCGFPKRDHRVDFDVDWSRPATLGNCIALLASKISDISRRLEDLEDNVDQRLGALEDNVADVDQRLDALEDWKNR